MCALTKKITLTAITMEYIARIFHMYTIIRNVEFHKIIIC